MTAPQLTMSLLFHARKQKGSLYVHGLRVDGASTRIAVVSDREDYTTTTRLVAYAGPASMEAYLLGVELASLELPADKAVVLGWVQAWGGLEGGP